MLYFFTFNTIYLFVCMFVYKFFIISFIIIIIIIIIIIVFFIFLQTTTSHIYFRNCLCIQRLVEHVIN